MGNEWNSIFRRQFSPPAVLTKRMKTFVTFRCLFSGRFLYASVRMIVFIFITPCKLCQHLNVTIPVELIIDLNSLSPNDRPTGSSTYY